MRSPTGARVYVSFHLFHMPRPHKEPGLFCSLAVHLPLAPMAADLVTIIETVAVTQFLTPGAKSLGEVALERGQRLATAAVQLLKNVGREPQPVEPKLLVPLVQAAALETDETLSDKWAALLANAADPAQQVAVQPGFVEVLRQLTPTDALVLDALGYPPGSRRDRVPSGRLMLKQFAYLNLPVGALTLSMDNLLRLRLCVAVPQRIAGVVPERPETPSEVISTAFGTQFLLACRVPTK